MTCICQNCGEDFKIDVLVPDDLWSRIRPFGKPEGAGLLCGACIINHIEALGHHGAMRLTLVEPGEEIAVARVVRRKARPFTFDDNV